MTAPAKRRATAKEIREAADQIADEAEAIIAWGDRGYFVVQDGLRAAVEHYRELTAKP